ncbi:MAG TPA: PA2169 family four-helix-bundle protein [Chitinophagaceae bacterium]|nr:PA2169 family four-helix-bundle protein [Chitinophagaceae bacterium]
MVRNDALIDVLNDLVQINNDRIAGYEKAIKDSKPEDSAFHSMFRRMIDESSQYKRELIGAINTLGGEADIRSTTASGKVYRVWMDVKSTFTGRSDLSVLELCEFGEDAAQKAYDEALKSDVEMPAKIREIIVNQKGQLRNAHDTIKRQRDLHAAAH